MFRNLTITVATISTLAVVAISMLAPAEARGRHWPGHSWNLKHGVNCHSVWVKRHNRWVRVLKCPVRH
jgi:hypothetical protein